MGFFSWLFKRNKPQPKKLGLALGSGGAKGYAELGVLRAFEENGVEFSVVAGTSIGSIIGAFYADGYSSTDILELLNQVDFSNVLTGIPINMDTSGIIKVIEDNLGEKNIEDLKKPFQTVATHLESGKEKVFSTGNLSVALASSSCMPPFLKPVVIDRQRYIDGAYVNSIPADLVKQMGADYIVGVDLSLSDNKTEGLSKLFPTYKGQVENPKEQGYKYSNVVLRPNLKGFSSISIKRGKEMFDIGYQTAIEQMPKILADIKALNNKKG